MRMDSASTEPAFWDRFSRWRVLGTLGCLPSDAAFARVLSDSLLLHRSAFVPVHHIRCRRKQRYSTRICDGLQSPGPGWEGFMLRRFCVLVFGIVVIGLFASNCSEAQHRPLLTHHLPRVTLDGQARYIGPLPGTQEMRVTIMLPLRNESKLDDLH